MNSNKKVVRTTRITYGYSDYLSVDYSDGSYEHINLAKPHLHPLVLKRQDKNKSWIRE